jgi:hypothetical protein
LAEEISDHDDIITRLRKGERQVTKEYLEVMKIKREKCTEDTKDRTERGRNIKKAGEAYNMSDVMTSSHNAR